MKHVSLAALLLLAACGSSGDAGNNSAGGEDAPAATVVEQTPANLMDDPGNSVVPLPANAATPAAAPAAALPAAFTGRWGMVANDCDPDNAANKGLLTIAPDKLSFYESRAVPGNIRLASPTKLTTDLAFSGEGQTWTQTVALTLLDDGKTLVREVTKGDDLGEKGALRYSRCPA